MLDVGISGNQIPLFLFKNHRMSFYYWCKVKNELDINQPFFVVTMDQHNDLAEPTVEMKSKIQNLDYNDLPKIEKFAKTKLGKLNDNWIYSAMEAGLVKDILLISPEKPFPVKDYIDSNNVKHRIFHCNSPRARA